jgi:hypothetical protein
MGRERLERENAAMFRMPARLQSALVVTLSSLVLAATLPAAFVGWSIRGSWGSEPFAVQHVTPGSPAQRAGVAPGDRLLYGTLPFEQRPAYLWPMPGARVTLPLSHAGTIRTISMTAAPTQVQPLRFERWLTVLEFATYAVYLIVGTTLVFLRPSPMTWWLWAYCVTWVPIVWLHWFYAFLDPRWLTAIFLFNQTFLSGSSMLPLLPFLLRFPNDRIEGWRAVLRLPVALVVAFGYAYYAWLAGYRIAGLADRERVSLLNGLPFAAIALAGLALLLVTYARATGNDKQRLRWAVFGMTLSVLSLLVAYSPLQQPRWVTEIFAVFSIAMPLSVAYAALRHRLLDLSFVLNRAVAYGLIAGLLIAVISLTDFVLAHLIADYHLTLGIEAAITVGLGFALDRVHHAMQHATERVFFRSRLEAAARLERVRGALAFASRDETVDSSLVDEPASALRLASAALFRRDPTSGRFRRGRSLGWVDQHAVDLDRDDALVRSLQFERKPLDPSDLAWEPGPLPRDAAQPTYVVPIFCREALEGFAVYGSHRDGTGTDPSERELLDQLAPAAAAALDHIAYENSERTVVELTRRLGAFAPVPELGGAPAD